MKKEELEKIIDAHVGEIGERLSKLEDKEKELREAIKNELYCEFCGERIIKLRYVDMPTGDTITIYDFTRWWGQSYNNPDNVYFLHELKNPKAICRKCYDKGIDFWGNKYLELIKKDKRR